MRKIENLDKLKHFGAGALAAAAPLLAMPLLRDVPLPVLAKAGLVLCVVVAALNEYRDAQGFGTPDGQDFIATVAGGLAVAVLML